MRELGAPVGADVRAKIVALVQAVYDAAGARRAVRASDFAMDDPADPVVVHEAEVKWSDGRLRVAATEASARPPFEWLWEITSDVGETDYFKHYLVLEREIVLAQRKVLTPIDEAEAEVVLHDLQAARKITQSL